MFVCMGNICRSPAAEHVMKTIVREAGLEAQINCDSCGTYGYHRGEAPDSRMVDAGLRRGFEITGFSRPITKADLDDFDYIFTMDDDNYHNVLGIVSTPEQEIKIKKFCSYLRKFSDTSVPDPYYGGVQGFDHVIDLLIDGCHSILDSLKEEKSAT